MNRQGWTARILLEKYFDLWSEDIKFAIVNPKNLTFSGQTS